MSDYHELMEMKKIEQQFIGLAIDDARRLQDSQPKIVKLTKFTAEQIAIRKLIELLADVRVRIKELERK